jgi:hypothetical protein
LRVIGLKKGKIGEFTSYEEFAKFVKGPIARQNISCNKSLEDIYREGCVDYSEQKPCQIFEFTLYKNPRASLNLPKKPTHRSNFLSKRAYYAD